MRIGYCVEGGNDIAFIEGIKKRWCPNAELVQGSLRGSTRLSIRGEMRKICYELTQKHADVFVFLTDEHSDEWRDTLRRNKNRIPGEYQHMTIFAVAHKEIEHWFCLDPNYCVRELGGTCDEWSNRDQAPGLFDKKVKQKWKYEAERIQNGIAEFVANANLKVWVTNSKSFETFYEDCRQLGKSMNCQVKNERE